VAQEEPRRTIRVLLADDHKLVRHAIVLLLDRQPGIEVIGEAGDGTEAVRMARELDPDVILMDVSMPGMSGTEATRCIKAELPHIRVIGLSMHDMDGVRERMMSAGADAYLTKDGQVEALLAAIYQTQNADRPSPDSADP